MKLTFLFSHCPDPRINKRIESLKYNYNTAILYWNRTPNLELSKVHNDIDNIEIAIAGNYTNPLKRIIPTLKFALSAIKQIRKTKPEFIYTGNIDMLLISYLSSIGRLKKTKIIYEIADLHRLIIDEPRNLIEQIFQKIITFTERILCKKISLLVLTSEKFYEVYFSKFIEKEKILFIPNMPNIAVFSNYRHKTKGKFTIGFIGVVRYKEQMKMLLEAAEKCNINILFAGSELDDEIRQLCKDKDFVEYYGKYDYNTEISKLYGKVDCIYSVYDANLTNVRIALPNKLYESIYCEVPIIVSKGTYLGEIVESMGVGVVVNHENESDLVNALNKLSSNNEYYYSIVENCKKNKNMININNYNKVLANIVEELQQ